MMISPMIFSMNRGGFMLRLGFLLSSMTSGASLSTSSSSSCAVVGAGVLGSSLCRQILEDPALSHVQVTAVTKTTKHHESIQEQVLGGQQQQERFRVQTYSDLEETFDNVVFCAPPSGFEDYPQAVQDAVESVWAGSDAGGVFLFTSSGAVYPQQTGEVTETTPIDVTNESPRIARLVGAEKASLSAGGSCLRLAGLYNLQRGAHNYWITSGKEVAGSPDGLINQLHYDDAAGACLAALKAGPSKCQGKVFLVSDSHPLTRKQICESSLKAAVYKDAKMPSFAAESFGTPVGKTYDCSHTYSTLNWKPQYESFDSYMSANT